uniref:ATP synthase F0 subunit 9 n=1 Tax=Alectoria fallacina TaxID=1903189 RepID=A0A2L2ATE2_9LECA|nr:ATP synthase F0 subunit 9 [Alectoria fallacina]AVG10473.1 ATP synthase F0 subunit 9 [Alectoria fallacina]
MFSLLVSVGWQKTSLFWLSLSHSVVPGGRILGRPRKPVFTLMGLPRRLLPASGNLNTRLLPLVLIKQLGLLTRLLLLGRLFRFNAISFIVKVII